MLNATPNEIMYYLGPVLSLFGAGGGAWLALKVGLNGARERIHKIEHTTDRIEGAMRKAETKLSVLETSHAHLAKTVEEHPVKCPWQPRGSDSRTRSSDV